VEIPSRRESIRAWRAEGGRVAAVFPIHHPRALWRAFGFLPVEVWGPPGTEPSLGDAHLQAYTCSIVRCGLAFLLQGGLDGVDLLVVPHACDSLQGLGSLLTDLCPPRPPVLTPYLPRTRGPAARAFLTAELRALGERLAGIAGSRPTDEDLMAAIRAEEEADDRVRALFAQRRDLALDNRALYRLLRAREYLPAERFVALCDEALAQRGSHEGPGVILSGLVPEPADLLGVLDAHGAVGVADDLACCGRRLAPPGTAADPWERLAERLLSGHPDPTLGHPVAERLAWMRAQEEPRAVIFWTIKSCEPELYDLPLLQRGLREAGVPSVALEIDLASPAKEQATTRLEALLERLST
jgi:benzoyl-CoA reductase/2-hydroxyglutaryl-CoA dehydratase subunit BcrC/BadD/HgdB